MHDEHAADEERQALRARATERDEEIRTLAARLAKDRALAARLASWRTGCPAGRLAELAAGRARTRATFAEEAEAELAEARTVRAEADEAAPRPPGCGTSGRRPPSGPAGPPTRSPDSPSGCASAPAGRSSCANWPTRPPSPRPAPQACLERARAADEDRRAAQRAADDARRTARALRAERAEIAGAPDDVPEADEDAPRSRRCPPCARPTGPPPSCTRRSASAPTCGPSRPAPRATRAPALAELDRLTNKVRTRAAQLLRVARRRRRTVPAGRRRPRRGAGADAGDPRVRRRASSSAGCAARPSGSRPRTARRTPSCPRSSSRRDAEHAQALLRTATAELAVPHRGVGARPATPTPNCCGAHRAAEDAAGGFDETAALLRDLLREHAARGRAGGARALPRQPWRRPGSRPPRPAARCAAAPPTCPPPRPPCARRATSSYGTPTPPATSRCAPPPASRSANCPRPRCPSTPQKWADAFAPRLRVLTDELEQLERNRDSIVDRLRGLVESALATLRSAQRLSRLPGGARRVVRAGVPAHPLRGARPGDAHRAARRGHRRGDPRGRQEELRPARGTACPCCCAESAPRSSPRASPSRSSSRTPCCAPSGSRSGRWATCSPAASCSPRPSPCTARWPRCAATTGAATSTGTPARCSSTTPSAAPTRRICWSSSGRSSDALGVQLLYTTGLFDTTALAEFPLVIRLRNDADLRAGPEVHQRRGTPAAGSAAAGPGRSETRCTARSPRRGCSSGNRSPGSGFGHAPSAVRALGVSGVPGPAGPRRGRGAPRSAGAGLGAATGHK